MSGRQTGPFVAFPHGGRPVALPPTGRAFAVKHPTTYVSGTA